MYSHKLPRLHNNEPNVTSLMQKEENKTENEALLRHQHPAGGAVTNPRDDQVPFVTSQRGQFRQFLMAFNNSLKKASDSF